MKYQVIILPAAKVDIKQAAKWIRQNNSPEKAKLWVREVNDAILTLDTFPARCALASIDNAFEEEIRQLLFGKGKNTYRVFFTIQDTLVIILRVLYTARDIEAEFEAFIDTQIKLENTVICNYTT
ncbi:hypothetical protein DSM106972_062300 [Dulcicalothrix desertica PCC 7102]|uniref:Plasmid stabilization protein n=1 Tax=Dulcicalothrix desertica PCC 7102 TaxID=232991 RepID=A0A433V7T9_9CYAN|nr:type II toxin-antitoxin system RelE/ParE family toxin [Dulcicalothrix desertica]RUT02155.1 hypothetical protein DSM106972_062300 [Dulcicalothrix desertica PCC 7102]TWH53800.1 plasmid stabilization system protein ParE [Dulcicalothrix desertica PCC 7102]